jgi:hypothetical protein
MTEHNIHTRNRNKILRDLTHRRMGHEYENGVAYLLSYTVSVEKKCGHRIHVLFMMCDVYWYCQMKKKRMITRNLAENSETASFLGKTTSYETEVQEREPWDFYEWITCNEKLRCAPNIVRIMFWLIFFIFFFLVLYVFVWVWFY